jgi:hypothetical protein
MALLLLEKYIPAVRADGIVTNKTAVFSATTGVVAGGNSNPLAFGGIGGIGIYFGSGAPTITAPQGSLYLRTDGSSVSTRLYINTTGSTTWTAVTTAA